jgi:hypothetical protein
VTYLEEKTLAWMYAFIGLEWIHTDRRIGLDVRKFNKAEVFRVRTAIEKVFKLKGDVVQATDLNYIITFPEGDIGRYIRGKLKRSQKTL